ncbi:MAG: hypothetical protein HW402_1335 [Dehalococcoidales bacterium]|nr:hypothetical protein [Dehalococcoidales bacterium]
MAGILEGIKVLNMAHVVAIPAAATILVAMLTLSGCARPAPPPAPPGVYGELRIAEGGVGLERLNPVVVPRQTVGIQLSPFLDSLFREDRPGEPLQPGIVEKWALATDGLSWTYQIRQGVKFHNGEDLKADDVKFSLELYMQRDAYGADIRTSVERVELVDDYTLRLDTIGKQPFLPYLSSQVRLQGMVLPKDYIERNGMDYFERRPIGSGPFHFVRNFPGDSLEYEVRDNHWRKTPEFKKLVIMTVPEESTRVAALKAGGVDVISVGYEPAVELEGSGYRTYICDTVSAQLQFFYAYDPRVVGQPITDIRVRQALGRAINAAEIRQSFFMGQARLPLPPGFNEASTDIDIPYWREYVSRAWRFDPAESRRLLKEAGYPDGFNIKLYTFALSGRPWLPKMAEIIQSYWKKIGVKVEITPIEPAAYTAWQHGPAAPLLGAASTFGHMGNEALTTRVVRLWEGGGGTTLIAPGVMPELDKLIADVQSETDESRRREMLARIIKLQSDTYTTVTFGLVPTMAVLGDRVDISFPSPLPSPYLPTYAAEYKHRK